MFLRLCILALALSASSSTGYARSFGDFIGDPEGEYIEYNGVQHFRLSAPFKYKWPDETAWTAPAAEMSDGASIPKWARWLVGKPFDPENKYAAIIHDYYCCSKAADFDDTHTAFYNGVRARGASATKAWVMRSAIYLGGPARWTVDANPPSPCYFDGPRVLSSDTNAEVRKIMLSKLISITRTLKTTDGAVLDIVGGEPILTDSDAALTHLNNLHDAARRNFDYPREILGVFTNVEPSELESLESVRPWAASQLPTSTEFYNAMASTEPAHPQAIEDPFAPAIREIPDEFVDE